MGTLYQDAAKVLCTMEMKKRGLRDVFYSRNAWRTKSLTYNQQVLALVSKVMPYCEILDTILLQGELSSDEQVSGDKKTSWSKRQCIKQKKQHDATLSLWLQRVMVWDLLFGGGLKGGGRAVRQLREKKDLLLRIKDGHQNLLDKIPPHTSIPRYLRVNTHCISFDNAMQEFRKTLPDSLGLSVDPFVKHVIRVNGTGSVKQLSCHQLIQNGSVVFQDRASCLPVQVAGIQPGMSILDVCAAPGNRLSGRGRLWAIEKNFSRALVLLKRLTQLDYLRGPFFCLRCQKVMEETELKQWLGGNEEKKKEIKTKGCRKARDEALKENSDLCFHFINTSQTLFIHIFVADVLKIDAKILKSTCLCCRCESSGFRLDGLEDYKQLDTVLVDPSCSGSGLPLHQVSFKSSKEKERKRIKSLSLFQTKVLTHILLKFFPCPQVLYSTCSCNVNENELVVVSAVQNVNNSYAVENITPLCWSYETNEAKVQDYLEMANLNVSSLRQVYDQCFHTSPTEDECRGFFLAKLTLAKPLNSFS